MGVADAFSQVDSRFPAEGKKPADIHELARSSVRFGSVENEGSLESEHLADSLGEFLDRDILAAADVHDFGRVVIFEKEKTGVGEVVHMKKLTARRAAAPHGNLLRSALLGLMHLADERR